MEEFKLSRSTLDRLPTALLKGVMIALLEEADENGVLTISVREFATRIGIERQPMRTALRKLQEQNLINPTANPISTQRLTQITINNIEYYATFAPKHQPKANPITNPRKSTKNIQKALTPDYITPPFVEPQFADTWRKFIEYRKEIKKPYKSSKTEEIAYNKMVEMSGHDPAKAKDMVERTILGQWQGLFPNKDNGSYTNAGQADRYTELERAAEAILRQPGNIDTCFNDKGRYS